MGIGGIDTETTKRNIKVLERKQKVAKRVENYKIKMQEKTHSVKNSDSDEDKNDDQNNDKNENYGESKNESQCKSNKASTPRMLEELNQPSTSKTGKSQYTRLVLTNLAEACDRSGVSDRSASLIVNAALKDFGLISKEDSSKIAIGLK